MSPLCSSIYLNLHTLTMFHMPTHQLLPYIIKLSHSKVNNF